MKIAVAQTKSIKGAIQKNIDKHLKLIQSAISNKTDLIIFPELSITGYEPTLARELAIDKNDSSLDCFQKISNENQIIIGLGMPTKNKSGICISLFLFQPNKPRKVYSKKYLHPDENAFFIRGENFPYFEVKGIKIALAICYELSIPEHSESAIKSGTEIYIASVSKSANEVMKASENLVNIAKKYSIPVLFANNIGPSDDFVAGGNSTVWNKKGALIGQLDDKTEGVLIYSIKEGLISVVQYN